LEQRNLLANLVPSSSNLTIQKNSKVHFKLQIFEFDGIELKKRLEQQHKKNCLIFQNFLPLQISNHNGGR